MTWTDGKLEERLARIDDRFDHVDEAVVAVKSEVSELRHELKAEMRELRTELKGEMRELREEMKEIRRSIEGIHLMMHRDRRIIIVTLLTLVLTVLVNGVTS